MSVDTLTSKDQALFKYCMHVASSLETLLENHKKRVSSLRNACAFKLLLSAIKQ